MPVPLLTAWKLRNPQESDTLYVCLILDIARRRTDRVTVTLVKESIIWDDSELKPGIFKIADLLPVRSPLWPLATSQAPPDRLIRL